MDEQEQAAALQRLQGQLLQRWDAFPADQAIQLAVELTAALERARHAEPQTLTVMNPVSRPQRLQLAVLVRDSALDPMYSREWAELAVDSTGRCFLVYRRDDGGDYAVEWSPATSIPQSMAAQLTDSLALAMLASDD